MSAVNDWLDSTSLLEHPNVKRRIELARAQLGDLDARSRTLIQERPVLAVGTALLVGYALARMIRGR